MGRIICGELFNELEHKRGFKGIQISSFDCIMEYMVTQNLCFFRKNIFFPIQSEYQSLGAIKNFSTRKYKNQNQNRSRGSYRLIDYMGLLRRGNIWGSDIF